MIRLCVPLELHSRIILLFCPSVRPTEVSSPQEQRLDMYDLYVKM